MALAFEVTRRGDSTTRAAAELPGAPLNQLTLDQLSLYQPSLDTPVSRNPSSALPQIAAEAILSLEESRLTDFEVLA